MNVFIRIIFFLCAISMAGYTNASSVPVNKQAPEPFIKAYTDALKALDIDDWDAMSLPLKEAKDIAINHFDNNIVVSAVTILQVIEKFSNTSSEKNISKLDAILDSRLEYIANYDRETEDNESSVDYLELITKNLDTTNRYLSRKNDLNYHVDITTLDEDLFDEYTKNHLVAASVSKTELLINSTQLITFSILKLRDGNVDDAYEALRLVTIIDKNILEKSGYLINYLVKKQLAISEKKNEISDQPGLELWEISELLEKEKYQAAHKNIQEWIGKYPNSSSKRLGVAYLIYAESISNLKKYPDIDEVQKKLKNSLNNFDKGFGKGNLLSGLVEFKIISDICSDFPTGNFGKGSQYRKRDALHGIKLINDWKDRYIYDGQLLEVSFLENLITVQLDMLHFGGDISVKNPTIQKNNDALSEIVDMESSGDLASIMKLLMHVDKKNKKSTQVAPEQFEKALSKLTYEAISEK